MKVHPRTRPAAGRVVFANPAVKPMGLAATALAAALLFAAAGADAAPPQRSAEGPWAKGRVLVMPKPGLPSAQVDRIAAAEGGTARRLASNNLHLIELPAHVPETAVLARFKNNPHFEFAELDALIPLDSSNDPYYGSQWHLPKIRASEAWSSTTGTGVTVAILDSGVEPDHPDLKDRLVAGYNFYDGNTNTADVFGHGTKVAGAAAATLNNATGVASVAGNARIMPIRVTGTDGYASISMLANGITFAADKGARVANLSFAASGYSSIRSAAQYMKDKGGLVFVSAGNSNKDPAETSTTSLIVVSATDSNDVKTSFSNYGNHVHLSAPGAGIYSTAMGKTYASVSGTSFSAPISAATAALVMAANAGLSSAKVESILFSTAVDLGTTGRDPYYGHGRVDAAAAVAAALNSTSTTTTDTQAPNVAIGSPTGGATVSGLTTVDVSASDNVGVSKVELWVGSTLLATDTSAPYSFSWDTTKVANGTVSLAAKAFDAAGNAATSSAVTVNVSNSTTTTTTLDTTPPTAAISNPTNGSKVGATTVKVTGKASDNAGVSGLQMALYINGSLVASNSGKETLDYGWNTRRLKSGTYTLTLLAQDAAGNKTTTSISVYR